MKSIFIVIIAFLFSFISTQAQCEDSVFLTLRSNKKNIRVGDELQLYFTLKNASRKQYRFSILNNSLGGLLIITDENGNHFRWLSDIIYELKVFPDKDDFYLLNPGEEKTFTFKFVLEEGEKHFRNKLYKGYFLFYQKWAQYIYLENNRKIFFQGRYSASEGDRAAIKKYELNDLYEGALKSELLEIVIQEK